MWKPRVRTKNFSCLDLREKLPKLPVRSIIRFGSTTPTKQICKHTNMVEINTVEAIENSRSKLKMKNCFSKANINQAEWYVYDKNKFLNLKDSLRYGIEEINYPLVVKRIYGFKGHGMELLSDRETLETWLKNHPVRDGWYFEKYYSYNREYRLHCTKNGCFYACRKMLKEDAENRWYRNDSNCIWILESNPLFNKPKNWDEIVKQCIDALNATGLDIAAFDVRTQAKENPKFIILECNSAPAFGEITLQSYLQILPNLILTKNG